MKKLEIPREKNKKKTCEFCKESYETNGTTTKYCLNCRRPYQRRQKSPEVKFMKQNSCSVKDCENPASGLKGGKVLLQGMLYKDKFGREKK